VKPNLLPCFPKAKGVGTKKRGESGAPSVAGAPLNRFVPHLWTILKDKKRKKTDRYRVELAQVAWGGEDVLVLENAGLSRICCLVGEERKKKAAR